MSKSLGWNCSIIEQFCPVVAQNGQDSVFQILSSENLSVLPAQTKLTFAPNRDWIFQPKDKFGPQEEVFAPNKLFDLLEQFIAIAIDNQKRKQINQQKSLSDSQKMSSCLPYRASTNVSIHYRSLKRSETNRIWTCWKARLTKFFHKRLHECFDSVVQKYSHNFSEPGWGLDKCDATERSDEVLSGSEPFLFPCCWSPLH